MNLRRRIRIGTIVMKTYGAGIYFWMLIIGLIWLPVNAVAPIVKWTVRRRVERYTNVASKYKERTDSILQELQTFDRLSEHRKAQLVAARAALLEDYKQLQLFVSQLNAYRAPGMALLVPTVTYIQTKLERRRRKLHSIKKLFDKINGDTFYWDLVLWIAIPVAYSEELLGDLN